MKSVGLPTATVFYNETDNIVIIHPVEGALIDIEQLNEHHREIFKLTNGKPGAVLIRSEPLVTITDEARKETIVAEKAKYIIAQAIIVNNIADKIMGTFYIRYNKPKSPTKLFVNENEAIKWLKNEVKKYYAKNKII